jgi:protein SCO1
MAVPLHRRLALGLLAAAAIGALGACDSRGVPSASVGSFKAVDITGADYARELQLPDTEGRQRSLAEFKGKLVVVFFGFTQCPDVCPTTLLELSEVKKALGPDGDKLQVVFVSVDPERDTPEVLKGYVDNFGAGFIALRGTPEQTRAVAKHFKVFYSKVPGKTEGSYSIDHTAGAYVFDTQGRVRLFTRYGTGTQALLHDLQLLLKSR